jgi:hypothetical protein
METMSYARTIRRGEPLRQAPPRHSTCNRTPNARGAETTGSAAGGASRLLAPGGCRSWWLSLTGGDGTLTR